MRDATLSHASLIQAGRLVPDHVSTARTRRHRILLNRARILRDDADSDAAGTRDRRTRDSRPPPVAVINELFARTYFGDENPVGRHITVGAARTSKPLDLEIVGVAANARYGGLKREIPPVVYMSVPPGSDTQLSR